MNKIIKKLKKKRNQYINYNTTTMISTLRSNTNKLKILQKYGHNIFEVFMRSTFPIKNSSIYHRLDCYGKVIDFREFGESCGLGWHVDHILPQSLFPRLRTVKSNLQALNYADNISKSNKVDWLDKKIHNRLIKENEIHENIKRSRITLHEGETYWIYLNAKEKEPRIGSILEKTKTHILVNIDKQKYKVYPDRILFRDI